MHFDHYFYGHYSLYIDTYYKYLLTILRFFTFFNLKTVKIFPRIPKLMYIQFNEIKKKKHFKLLTYILKPS